jgi:hypothetical protein
MGYLNGRIAILKLKDADGDEPEMFELRYEDPEKADKPGYMFGNKYLNEEQLREALTSVGATEADLTRIITECRTNFKR